MVVINLFLLVLLSTLLLFLLLLYVKYDDAGMSLAKDHFASSTASGGKRAQRLTFPREKDFCLVVFVVPIAVDGVVVVGALF